MSSFSWLSYSEAEREQTLDVISLFTERGTLDELGIGRIRDAFAELLFPGTSTIQTRARYFLFVPWMYREFERRRTTSEKIAERARQYELNLIGSLLEDDDTDGVIGQQAGSDLKRLPSNIYWSGLGVWGIRQYRGSQNQYQRSLDVYYELLNRNERTESGDFIDEIEPNWDPHLPAQPDEFPKTAAIELRPADAEYLRDKILQSVPESMLAEILSIGRLDGDPRFPWEYTYLGQLSPAVQTRLHHAQNFSEVIHGASLLYNLLLARKACDGELLDQYEQELATWTEGIDARLPELQAWDTDQFWAIVEQAHVSTPPGMVRFVHRWFDMALAPDRDVATDVAAEGLIVDRERSLKGSRARLHEKRPLEQWSGNSGAGQLAYRWTIAKAHLRDIFDGLEDG